MIFVTTSEAKLHLRVDGADEDALIGVYITAADLAKHGFVSVGEKKAPEPKNKMADAPKNKATPTSKK